MPISKTRHTDVTFLQPQFVGTFHPRLAAKQRFELLPVLAALSFAFAPPSASATSFNFTDARTTAQTLGANEVGGISPTGSLTVSGGTVAVTVSGNNASLSNFGSITQTGSGRVIRDSTAVTGLTVTNGSATNSSALLRSANADVIQITTGGSSVILNNYGTLSSLNSSAGGAQAVDFANITTGANTVNNYATGVLTAQEADAVRTGVNGIVNNWGSIQALTNTNGSKDGISLSSNTGAQITNYGTGTIDGGRHGITGAQASNGVSFAASITNQLGGNIYGSNGSGLNFDGVNANQIITIANGGLIRGNGVTGDGDGIDVDGIANITNTGIIRSVNSFSAAGPAFSEGITIGGGTVTNSGTIEGLVSPGNNNALGRGISLSGNDIVGSTTGAREGLYGNAVVINNAGGLIRGQNDSAIVVEGAASIYTISITNNAGATTRGGSSTAAAIRTGADAASLINAGTLDGSSSGKAFQGGSGGTALTILGGQASVIGDIDGGSAANNTVVIHPGAGNGFSYSGSLSNFSSVEVQSGTATLSGASNYAGITRVSGGSLVLNGANRLSSASALSLSGGTLQLANAGGANGQTFSSLLLTANSAIDLGGSSLTFNALGSVLAGRALTLFDYVVSLSPDYAIRILGDVSTDGNFLALIAGLTINGVGASYHFDGTYTDISPVPLPPSLALLLAGVGCMGMLFHRRRPS